MRLVFDLVDGDRESVLPPRSATSTASRSCILPVKLNEHGVGGAVPIVLVPAYAQDAAVGVFVDVAQPKEEICTEVLGECDRRRELGELSWPASHLATKS